jgi:hypothetical protein
VLFLVLVRRLSLFIPLLFSFFSFSTFFFTYVTGSGVCIKPVVWLG